MERHGRLCRDGRLGEGCGEALHQRADAAGSLGASGNGGALLQVVGLDAGRCLDCRPSRAVHSWRPVMRDEKQGENQVFDQDVRGFQPVGDYLRLHRLALLRGRSLDQGPQAQTRIGEGSECGDTSCSEGAGGLASTGLAMRRDPVCPAAHRYGDNRIMVDIGHWVESAYLRGCFADGLARGRQPQRRGGEGHSSP